MTALTEYAITTALFGITMAVLTTSLGANLAELMRFGQLIIAQPLM